MQDDDIGIYRRGETLIRVGLADNTVRALVARGEFPEPVQISPRAVGWRKADIRAWLASRPVAHLPPVGRKAKKKAAALTEQVA